MQASLQPLAARLRPQSVNEFIGQEHLLAQGKPLHTAIENGELHSMILWGPPGCGKTTLAKILAKQANANVEILSAVMSGVKDIRLVVEKARLDREQFQQPTILFIDEIHRFNKSQQDAFLPFVEDGTVTLIGATTENPSFELNNALLSRARVYVLKPLTSEHILQLIENAIASLTVDCEFPLEQRQRLAHAVDGDARRCLNYVELSLSLAQAEHSRYLITDAIIDEVISGSVRQFDKGGDVFYEQISALHKSVRGSDPDASLYWYARMLDGGCDALYIARRVVRMASEDIGNADPRGLEMALNAWATFERLGSPEGDLAIAQAIVYLACAPKSNATYTAFKAAMQDAKDRGSLGVPMHLRNAPTKLMKNIGYGKDYRYAHDEGDAYAAGEHYFPDEMPPQRYYQPVERGLEIKIKQKLDRLREMDTTS